MNILYVTYLYIKEYYYTYIIHQQMHIDKICFVIYYISYIMMLKYVLSMCICWFVTQV
jgi:hypothetical protein